MNFDDQSLVKTVNGVLTGRKDHRAALKRFEKLTVPNKQIFKRAFHELALSNDDLKQFEFDLAEQWAAFDIQCQGGHAYFDAAELEVIEAVVGKTW